MKPNSSHILHTGGKGFYISVCSRLLRTILDFVVGDVNFTPSLPEFNRLAHHRLGHVETRKVVSHVESWHNQILIDPFFGAVHLELLCLITMSDYFGVHQSQEIVCIAQLEERCIVFDREILFLDA